MWIREACLAPRREYHVGATGFIKRLRKEIEIHLVSNPSPLKQWTGGVGVLRAKLTRSEGGFDRDVTNRVVRSYARRRGVCGQGILAETMNLADWTRTPWAAAFTSS